MFSTTPSFSKDIEVVPGATDSISDLSFSPVNDMIAATSWDNQLRVWDIQSNGTVIPKMNATHEGPALCCTWSKDGSKVFSGGADKQVRILDVQTGQNMNFLAHDQPIKCCKWMDGNISALVTAGWDKTLKYWDLRSPQAIAVVPLPERAYSMDIVSPLLVVGTAERHICIINLTNPTQIFKTIPSPLRWQTRTVACFPNAQGYAVGSIEGRVSVQYIDEKSQSLSFAFKCHRVDNNVYPVNSISFHPTYGTFSTAGSDGSYCFWDKDSKQRLKLSSALGGPVSCTAFNRTGSLFAYAVCYDWHKVNSLNSGIRRSVAVY